MDETGLEIQINKPLKLEPHQEWICNYLDRLNEKEKMCSEGILPSDLIKGALTAILNKDTNPDWMAQSAHSYREILYRLGGKKNQSFIFKLKYIFYLVYNKCCQKLKIKNKKAGKKINELVTLQSKKQNIENILQVLHEQKRAETIADTLYKTHIAFTKISHHFAKSGSKKETLKIFNKLGIVADEKNFPSSTDFVRLVQIFENTLKESSLDPLKIHEKIDAIIRENGKDQSYLRLLFSLNYDAKKYFFSQINEKWLDWLWQNGLLDDTKTKGERWMPELDYIARTAEKVPAEVSEIINSLEIADNNFNPDVVNRFLWIIGNFPPEQIKILAKKIYKENWVYLMRKFNQSGYEYSQIIDKLVKNKESDALLEITQAILTIKTKEDLENNKNSFGVDDPFYIKDLHASGIFEALADISDSHAKQALGISLGIFEKIIKLEDPDNSKIFDYNDPITLYDVDLFQLELEQGNHYSDREDLKNLIAVIKILIERLIGKKCDDVAMRIFNEYLSNLPTCRILWKLKLFTLSLCPELFKDELKKAFSKLFEVDEYIEIEGGTEYKKALKVGFQHLSNSDQRTFVENVFKYFLNKIKNDPEHKDWYKRAGWEILSSICNQLINDEAKDCENNFGKKCDEKFEPIPLVVSGQAGFISHKSHVNLNDFTVDQIITNLKTEWVPEKLNELFKNDDFLNPRGVEGLGDALKENIKKRTNDYIENINSFFDLGAIHPHYLYSLLRGIEEMFRNNQSIKLEQITKLLNLFEIIKNEGVKISFRGREETSWLAEWTAVHKVITDILLYILGNKDIKETVHKKHREDIKNIISYLLTIKDSPSKKHEKPEYGELYGVAINSVRGRAFEAFVVFSENDGKVLADDTKQIYKLVLSDDSLAVRFIIGRYLASFFFRDKDFIISLFPEIFPKDDLNKKDIYLATWEGYLSNTLYDKLFIELKNYYSHAITLDPKDYTQRKYFKGLDESLAIHLALAFAHLGLEIKDDLFIQFWEKSNVIRHQEFIAFIGQGCITRSQAGDEWLNENKVSKEKLMSFWDWALKNNFSEPKALSGFGFWINPAKEILNDNEVIEKMALTLKKSDGAVDWEYGLMNRLPIFAEKDSKKTLEIIINYLLDSKNNLNQNRRVPLYDDKIKEALKVIYKNGDEVIRLNVTNLINTLIEKGSSIFWALKEVLNADKN